jgi:uncharacterized protein
MKLQPDRIETQSVTAYGQGWIAIQGEKITHSVLITSEGLRLDWACSRFEDLTPQHFAQLAELDVELVIFGSGIASGLLRLPGKWASCSAISALKPWTPKPHAALTTFWREKGEKSPLPC